MTVATLLARAKDEWEDLGLMSYHGVGEADGRTMWRADLDEHDVDGIRALLKDLADALERSAPGLDAQLAQVERAWSRDRESLEAALYRLREAHEVIEELRRHGCDWIVELFTTRLQEPKRALRDLDEGLRQLKIEVESMTVDAHPAYTPNLVAARVNQMRLVVEAALAAAAAPSGPDEGKSCPCGESFEEATRSCPDCGRPEGCSFPDCHCDPQEGCAAPSGEPPSERNTMSTDIATIRDAAAKATAIISAAQGTDERLHHSSEVTLALTELDRIGPALDRLRAGEPPSEPAPAGNGWNPCLTCGRMCPFVFCDGVCARAGERDAGPQPPSNQTNEKETP